MFECAKRAQKAWAKTPLYKRAELLHRVADLMRQNSQPMADCLVKEIAKPAKDRWVLMIGVDDITLINYAVSHVRRL